MIVIAEDSVRFAHSGPSHNLLRPAIAELVSCGPLPLPVSGGGHASAITTILPIIYIFILLLINEWIYCYQEDEH